MQQPFIQMSDTHVGENFSFICLMKTVWNNKNVTFASVLILYKYVSAMATCGSFPLVVEAPCVYM